MLLLRCNNGIFTTGIFPNLRKSIFNWANWINLTAIISLHLSIAFYVGRLSNLKAAFSSKIQRIWIIFVWTFLFLLLSFVQCAKTFHNIGLYWVLMWNFVYSMITSVYGSSINRLLGWNWEWFWLIICVRTQC